MLRSIRRLNKNVPVYMGVLSSASPSNWWLDMNFFFVPGFPVSQVPSFPGSQVPRFLVLLPNLRPRLIHKRFSVFMICIFTKSHVTLYSKAFRRSLVLASQTTNIILVHLKQFCFHHLKTIKLLWPFLVLQRNDHSLYVRILLFYLKLYDLFHNKHLFFF